MLENSEAVEAVAAVPWVEAQYLNCERRGCLTGSDAGDI